MPRRRTPHRQTSHRHADTTADTIADAVEAARSLRRAGDPEAALGRLDAVLAGVEEGARRAEGVRAERRLCFDAIAARWESSPAVAGRLEPGATATVAALDAFAGAAAQDGRHLVVGAAVTDGAGRLFVQRRSEARALFPGCWDLVGGHAEPGEGVIEALARELREETGWRLASVGPVVEVLDWEGGGEAKREVDLVVRADGPLDAPRLERHKHSEARWLRPDDLPLLLERRDPDDRFVHTVALRAFALLRTGRV